MITVIPMAGKSQRFTDAGYPIPKYMLLLEGRRSMIECVVRSIAPSHCIMIVASSHKKKTKEIVDGFGYMDGTNDIISITAETGGAIQTLLAAQAHLKKFHEEVLVNYCDVFLTGGYADFIESAREKRARSAFVIFESRDPRYGYFDGQGIVEKKTVSTKAVSGMFYFRSMIDLLENCAVVDNAAAGLPSALQEAMPFEVAAERIIDVGTPEDYEQYVKRYKQAERMKARRK